MAEDINKIMLVGRLTREAELQYTNSGYPICKFSLAVNRRKKQGDQWVDEANFFDLSLWGKRGEALLSYLTKGTQVAVEGQLKQERWEQDGKKRSKITVEAVNIQLLGNSLPKRNTPPGTDTGYRQPPPQNGHNQQGSMANQQSFESHASPSQPSDNYEDDIPF